MERTLGDLLASHSQARVAFMLGVNRSTVHRWARGQASPPLARISALARILKVDVKVVLKACEHHLLAGKAAAPPAVRGASRA